MKYLCATCDYKTDRLWSFNDHQRRQSACEKRNKRHDNMNICQNVTYMRQSVTDPCQNVTFNCQSVTLNKKKDFTCSNCNKILASNRNLERHIKICKGIKENSLECSICKMTFTNRTAKSRHVKVGSCIPCKDEKDCLIEHLEKQLEERDKELEEEKQRRKEAEQSKSTVNNYITNNNYFDNSINYNNYDQLSMEHITNEDIKRLYDNCKMQYPELSEDLTRLILSLKENQSIYLQEGQKSNTCTVMKDGLEMRKPLIRVLMNLGMQTAMFIRNSNVIERDRKNYVNNQFWADNRNACGLHISGMDEMTDSDKEIVQRNKNVVLDMCEGRV